MTSSNFDAWAKEYGITRLAKALGIHRTSVHRWISGDSVPSDAHRIKIIAMSKGKIKLRDLVEGY